MTLAQTTDLVLDQYAAAADDASLAFFDLIDYSTLSNNGVPHPHFDPCLKLDPCLTDYSSLGYPPPHVPVPPPTSVYPTPAESLLDVFDGSPAADYDKIFANLLSFDTTPASLHQPAQVAHHDFALETLFGDTPLFDHADSLFPSVPQDALFPALDHIGPSPPPPPPAPNSVTLSFDQLSALLQAAAESGKSPALAPIPAPPLASPDPLVPKSSRPVKDSRRRNAKYTCPHPGCGKHFTRHFNLKSHLPLHDPERPRLFDCNECGKSFFKQNDLARHANTHGGENQCECSCGKRYSRVDALKRHMKATGCADLDAS